MNNIIYQIIQGAFEHKIDNKEQFVELKQKLHDEIISKAKGFISWEHYLQGDIWTDFVL